MKANFAKSLKAVLVHEGGYVNHPADPGGATNFGVTQKVYDAWRVGRGDAKRSVKGIDKAEVEAIFRRQYWDAVSGDELPAGIDYVVFDGAVNSGPSQSIKWLQRALSGYTGPIDGVLGVRTLRRVREDEDHDALVARICDRRMAFLKALKTWKVFGKGWTKRVAGVKAMGQAMATGKLVTKAMMEGAGDEGAAKAPVADASAPPAKGGADAVAGTGATLTGGGITGFGLTEKLNDAQSQLQPLVEYSTTIAYLSAGLVTAGILFLLGGLGWRAYATLRAKRLAAAVG